MFIYRRSQSKSVSGSGSSGIGTVETDAADDVPDDEPVWVEPVLFDADEVLLEDSAFDALDEVSRDEAADEVAADDLDDVAFDEVTDAVLDEVDLDVPDFTPYHSLLSTPFCFI